MARYYNDGLRMKNNRPQTLIWDLLDIVESRSFSFILLIIIKQEIEINPQDLGAIFDDEKVVWTFSDSRHAQHRILTIRIDGTLCRLLQENSGLHKSGRSSLPSSA